MPALTNIRHTVDCGVEVVCADFQSFDGRIGSVCVPKPEFEAHGEIVLQQLADACDRQAAGHRYRPPEHDRYSEIR